MTATYRTDLDGSAWIDDAPPTLGCTDPAHADCMQETAGPALPDVRQLAVGEALRAQATYYEDVADQQAALGYPGLAASYRDLAAWFARRAVEVER